MLKYNRLETKIDLEYPHRKWHCDECGRNVKEEKLYMFIIPPRMVIIKREKILICKYCFQNLAEKFYEIN